jgi:hypothetical protein
MPADSLTRERASLSAEWSLLVACARARAAGTSAYYPSARDVNIASSPAFVELADTHGMIAIAADLLRPSARLRARATECARRALQHAHEMVRLSATFRSSGIDALFYKGPVLAQVAYDNIGLRDYADLDLLIDAGCLENASEVLGQLGYAPGYALTPAQHTAFTRTDGDYPFYGPDGILVELHCRVSSERFGVRLYTADLLQNSIDVDVLGTPVRTLAPPDHALVLCVHGCKHEWQRLEWLVALVALARACSLDIDDLLARADTLRARRNALLSLGLASRLLELKLTTAVSGALASDVSLQALIGRAERNLLGGMTSTTASRMLFNMRAKDSLLDQVAFAYRWLALPTPEDWKTVRVPDRLAPLYHLIRPLRLATRAFKT